MSAKEYDTIRVQSSKVVARADGRAAIVLEGLYPTNEPAAIAFEVTLENLAVLRLAIAKAEQILSASPGQA